MELKLHCVSLDPMKDWKGYIMLALQLEARAKPGFPNGKQQALKLFRAVALQRKTSFASVSNKVVQSKKSVDSPSLNS